VLSASLNPEHIATRYHFEYGPCPTLAGCAGVRSTVDETTPPSYGIVGANQEASGLVPLTTYAYRLIATNEYDEAGEKHEHKTVGPEATFTTIAAPSPSVETGGYSAVTSTSVVISGMVNPDGLPASYAFELGVYNGANTQYGIVLSASAGSSGAPVEETLGLSGLQPGTTYAYRITVSSGYIENETHTLQGATVTFTTAGVPEVLALPPVLAQLPIPTVPFPNATTNVSKSKAAKGGHKKTRKVKRKKHGKGLKARHARGRHRTKPNNLGRGH
jgi:phosphodiesterase/alkaline phosphatase D-like protein